MILKGLQKTTLIDFPGHVACTVFTQNCNFRCHFCHNPELAFPNNPAPDYAVEDFFEFLQSRKGLLEGVCITGGEPTLYADLPEFIERIKKLGFKVKLDSNGTNPEMLKSLLESKLVDYVAMDIKNSAEKYAETVGLTKLDLDKIKESIALLKESNIPYEFRTTIVPGLHTVESLRGVGELIKGAPSFTLQNFRKGKTLDPTYADKPSFLPEELAELKKVMEEYVEMVEVR
ncbi:MAG: anaerobic ribonucleoside-triphosphate reductase activating protein [Candidatus Gracilibacteria bacterium]|nr:anaerobic ribonucleoside-triphosphate reductase activating protein [Candidatus Gracilibacteria bacterium]